MFASVQSTNPTASALVSSNISKFKKNKRTKTRAHRISSLSSCGVENEIDEDCCTNRDLMCSSAFFLRSPPSDPRHRTEIRILIPVIIK